MRRLARELRDLLVPELLRAGPTVDEHQCRRALGPVDSGVPSAAGPRLRSPAPYRRRSGPALAAPAVVLRAVSQPAPAVAAASLRGDECLVSGRSAHVSSRESLRLRSIARIARMPLTIRNAGRRTAALPRDRRDRQPAGRGPARRGRRPCGQLRADARLGACSLADCPLDDAGAWATTARRYRGPGDEHQEARTRSA